jgi:hypothetical protein
VLLEGHCVPVVQSSFKQSRKEEKKKRRKLKQLALQTLTVTLLWHWGGTVPVQVFRAADAP